MALPDWHPAAGLGSARHGKHPPGCTPWPQQVWMRSAMPSRAGRESSDSPDHCRSKFRAAVSGASSSSGFAASFGASAALPGAASFAALRIGIRSSRVCTPPGILLGSDALLLAACWGASPSCVTPRRCRGRSPEGRLAAGLGKGLMSWLLKWSRSPATWSSRRLTRVRPLRIGSSTETSRGSLAIWRLSSFMASATPSSLSAFCLSPQPWL
mmetsp:Transcript_101436/g.295559  ORF Transcript_101436/g.295559 Transcript_101436/m.295559 type:complete len:212 (-) Transcript_101436:1990-2625(-)